MDGKTEGNLALWTHSMRLAQTSKMAGVIEAIQRETALGLGSASALIPVTELQELITAIDQRAGHRMSAQDAYQAATALLGMYPAREVHNAPIFTKAMCSLLQAYEHDFVRRVIDPVDGLPSRSKWLPTLAETKEALEAERSKRTAIRLAAAWMLKEHERRRLEREEAERWKVSPEELERRRQQVAELMTPKDMRS